MFALWQLGYLAFDGRGLHGAEIWKYAAVWGLVFLGAGIFEESLLRGYLQFTMTRGVGFWWGALVFSLLFGLGHTVTRASLRRPVLRRSLRPRLLCLSLWYTGSLWWAVGFHAAWDWGESYFYGTADSGLVSQGHLFRRAPGGEDSVERRQDRPRRQLVDRAAADCVAILMWLWWGRRGESPFKGQAWRPAWSRKPQAIEDDSIERAA